MVLYVAVGMHGSCLNHALAKPACAPLFPIFNASLQGALKQQRHKRSWGDGACHTDTVLAQVLYVFGGPFMA